MLINRCGTGASGTKITPKQVTNLSLKPSDMAIEIKWSDPVDSIFEGTTISGWEGTKIIMKESGYPVSPSDGTLILDNVIRNRYSTEGFPITGLINGTTYYFAAFPYNTKNVYNVNPSGQTASAVPVAFVQKTLEAYSWPELDEIFKGGQLVNGKWRYSGFDLFQIGDEKRITLSTNEVLVARIIDFKHDDLTSGGVASVTFDIKDCMSATRYMNTSNTNVGGYTATAMRAFCEGELYNNFPADLKQLIKPVNKKTSAGNASSTINTSSEKIWLLSEVEVRGGTVYSAPGEGKVYPIYTADASRVKKCNGSAAWWWLRSPYSSVSTIFCFVYSDGSADSHSASGSDGVAFGFCI